MSIRIARTDIEEAVDDLNRRTLAHIPGEFARFVYLASTRDYNTGRYYHEGLSWQFTPEVTVCALAICHEEFFKRLVYKPLADLVGEVKNYIASLHEGSDEVLEAWTRLEPFRVAIPLDHNPLEAELFLSNVRVALAILRAGRAKAPGSQPGA